MTARTLFIPPGSRGQALSILGHFVTPLALADAGCDYEVFLIEGPCGSGPRPHRHPWDEALYVTHGAVDVTVGEQTLRALPGTLVHVPAGLPHGFNFAEGGEMLCITSRGDAAQMFYDIDREISPAAPDRSRLEEITSRHGLQTAD